MIVNGKDIGPAMTHVSQDYTNKFWNMDRIMFAMSPFLTYDESDKIIFEMEKRAKSKLEANWTHGDCLMFLRETLGNDRWNAVERMWEIQNQNAVTQLFKPEELKETWVDPITMCEVSDEIRAKNPGSYIQIMLPI
jgi:hypothetical protein